MPPRIISSDVVEDPGTIYGCSKFLPTDSSQYLGGEGGNIFEFSISVYDSVIVHVN